MQTSEPWFGTTIILKYNGRQNAEMQNEVDDGSLRWQMRILHFKGLAYLQMKSIDEAMRVAEELKKLVQRGLNENYIRFYYHLLGMIELEREEFSKAIESLKKAKDLLYSPNENFPEYNPLFIYTLADAYYRAGDLEKAREEYEKIVALAFGRLNSGDIYAKSIYMLGKVHQELGEKDRAREYFERFINLWEDADNGLFEIADAKRRIGSL